MTLEEEYERSTGNSAHEFTNTGIWVSQGFIDWMKNKIKELRLKDS